MQTRDDFHCSEQVVYLEQVRFGLSQALWLEEEGRLKFMEQLYTLACEDGQLALGYSSVYKFLIEEMQMSEDQAFVRHKVVMAAVKYPQIMQSLRKGLHHMSGLVQVIPHLNKDNVDELLKLTQQLTVRKTRELMAEMFPAMSKRHEWESLDRVTYLNAERSKLVTTLDRETEAKLEELKGLMFRQSGGKTHQVIASAIHMAHGHALKQKAKITDRERNLKGKSRTVNGRHIPAHIKSEVWQRAEGRCEHIGTTGHRCSERFYLEFDHYHGVAIHPFHDKEEIHLTCWAHNQFRATKRYGKAKMAEHRCK